MRIVVMQAQSFGGDIPRNIQHHDRMIGRAVDHCANLVIFPELSLTGYESDLAAQLATGIDDPRLDIFQRTAATHNVTVGVGLPTRHDTGVSISMALFPPFGPRERYSKKYIHADEEPYFVSGDSTVSLIGDGDIALAICYELSVPAHADNAHRQGAKVYIASAVKTAPQVERAHERLAEIARMYSMTVLLSNCVGRFENDHETGGGRSAIWNREGRLLAELDASHEGVLLFDTKTGEILSDTFGETL